jgi:hypothetical protein
LQNGLTIAICLAALSMTLYKMNRNNRVEPNRFRPEKEKFYYKGFYQSPYNLIETHKLLKLIPSQAKVSASENLFSHLAQRQHIYFFPTVKDAEYVIFSVFDNYFRLSHMENERQRNKYLTDPDWEIIGEEFPVFLLKKKETPGSVFTLQNKLEFETDTLTCNFEIIDTLANQVLFDNGIIADSPNRLNSDRSRSGNHSLLLMNDNRYGKAIQFNDINDFSYIISSVWFYGKDKNATIAARFGSRFYFYSNTVIERDHSNWKKLELSFWVPQKGDNTDFVIHLGNGTKEDSLFFDDFQIIRRFK